MTAKKGHRPAGIKRALAAAPRQPRSWLRPTFLVTRGTFRDFNRDVQLEPVYIAVLSVDVDADTATYEILGCNASPSTVGRATLAAMLRERGTKQ